MPDADDTAAATETCTHERIGGNGVWECCSDCNVARIYDDYAPCSEWFTPSQVGQWRDEAREAQQLRTKAALADEMVAALDPYVVDGDALAALQFYATRENYLHDDDACPPVCSDEGDRARALIARLQAATGGGP